VSVDCPAVRVRIAPSPTGYMHVGTARTALFNWLFARHTGGTFVLRVEDTDRGRYVPDALEDLYAGLRWLGLEPDEGPERGGPHAPYLQSQRRALYDAAAQTLLEAGHAYRCFCSAERLARVRERSQVAGGKVGYDRRCRDLPGPEAAARAARGERHVVRLAMPLAGTLTLRDRVRGAIVFDAGELEDVVLIKGDGFPTYHLAVVVDDHAMGITHVLRADEWIPSAPVQVRLYEAFGWPEPEWAHLPLVLDPSGKGKLSKRKTAAPGTPGSDLLTQVREYRAAGFLPEAMLNFLALQGWAWSGEDEIADRATLVERFDLADVRPAPSAWDMAKLRWMNGVYIRALPPDELAERLLPFLRRAGLPAEPDQVRRMAPLVQERLETLEDGARWLGFFWADSVAPHPGELVAKKLDAPTAARVLGASRARLAQAGPWEARDIETALRAVAAELGLGAGPTFHPVRVAVTGQSVSPPLFETLAIVGREQTLTRLDRARALLEPDGGDR